MLRQGREIKPIKSLARQLSMTEMQLHETFKQLDTDNDLPYGYYDKIEKVYVRTHQDEDLDEDLLLEMIFKAYGYKVFHHQGLTGFIREGRHIPSRKVLNVLHQLRKKEKLIGFKKGPKWLWRLPNPNLSNEITVNVGKTKLSTSAETKRQVALMEKENSQNLGFSFTSDELDLSPEEPDERGSRKSRKKTKKDPEEPETDNENYSLAELTRSVTPNTGEEETDEDDEFDIIFVDAEEDE